MKRRFDDLAVRFSSSLVGVVIVGEFGVASLILVVVGAGLWVLCPTALFVALSAFGLHGAQVGLRRAGVTHER